MKSGTNDFHGTAYDYFVNEALNASESFSHVKPRERRNDYGFTLGGPVWIPRVYDGHDKTLFFFNFEQFRETLIHNDLPVTVPTEAYRNGDFSALLPRTPRISSLIGEQFLFRFCRLLLKLHPLVALIASWGICLVAVMALYALDFA